MPHKQCIIFTSCIIYVHAIENKHLTCFCSGLAFSKTILSLSLFCKAFNICCWLLPIETPPPPAPPIMLLEVMGWTDVGNWWLIDCWWVMPPEAEGGGAAEGPPWEEVKPIAPVNGVVVAGIWWTADVGGAWLNDYKKRSNQCKYTCTCNHKVSFPCLIMKYWKYLQSTTK